MYKHIPFSRTLQGQIVFFQFFCIPLAVIGATRLWCDEQGISLAELRQEQLAEGGNARHELQS